MSDKTPSHNSFPQEIPENKAKPLRWLLILATLLLGVGLTQPMMTLSQFVWFNQSFSVASGVWQLFQNGQYVIFVLVASFSILLPLLKIKVLYTLLSGQLSGRQYHRFLHLMHDYGRWAMLDVMVVAVLIVTVKLGLVATIQIHYGFFVFAASVILIMLITGRVVKLTGQ